MATYYIRTDGSNANGGTGTAGAITGSEAWKDISYGFSNAVAGDAVVICADAIHGITEEVVPVASDWRVIGAAADGTIDGTRPIVQATATYTGSAVFDVGVNGIQFRHIEADANGECASAFDLGNRAFAFNCIGRNATTQNYTSLSTDIHVDHCQSYDAGTYGFNLLRATASNCYSERSGLYEYYFWRGSVITNCVAYKSAGGGYRPSTSSVMNNCVAVECDADGFDLNGSSIAHNCISINNTDAGFASVGAGNCLYNCVAYGNTGGATLGDAFVLGSEDPTEIDPLLVSPAGSTGDYGVGITGGIAHTYFVTTPFIVNGATQSPIGLITPLSTTVIESGGAGGSTGSATFLTNIRTAGN